MVIQEFPWILKFTFSHFAFIKHLYQNLCFLTKKDLKRIFYFPTKGKRHKQRWVCVLQQPLQRQHREQQSGGPAQLLRWEPHSIKPPSPWAVVCEHLHFISIHFVHLLARWVRLYQKGLRELLTSFMFSAKASVIVLITVNGRHCVCIEFWVQEAKNYFHIN